MSFVHGLRWSALALALTACATPPASAPPLRDMEEPAALFEPPGDEQERIALPLGGFTGCYVAGAAQDSLEALLGEGEHQTDGVVVERIVENSPADAAGLRAGDLLIEAGIGDGPRRPLRHPSAWRELELASRAGEHLQVVFDRANRRARTEIVVIDRVRPPARGEIERLREEQRVGVVVRTATEVEARSAGLGPGGGAVIVGLARSSPWRAAGLRFGDVITEAGGRRVEHPQVVLDAIRQAGDELAVVWMRDGERMSASCPLSRRAQEVREIFVPPLLWYEADRGRSDTSLLFGLIRYQATEAAWHLRLLWFVGVGGGDADRLIEVAR